MARRPPTEGYYVAGHLLTNAWRDSRSLAGVRSQLVAAVRNCDDGAYVTLDMKTALNLIEVCDQAIHTEKGHEPLS